MKLLAGEIRDGDTITIDAGEGGLVVPNRPLRSILSAAAASRPRSRRRFLRHGPVVLGVVFAVASVRRAGVPGAGADAPGS